jgi:putative transposase
MIQLDLYLHQLVSYMWDGQIKVITGIRRCGKGGYYVSTVGLNEAAIRKYIQDQERADIIQDKLSVKEYEDPFKGQGK